MITKYKQFNEGIKQLLVGPSEKEIINSLKDEPLKLYKIGCEDGYLDMVKYALEKLSTKSNISIFDFNDGLTKASENKYNDIFKYIVENYEINWNQVSVCGTFFCYA